MNHSLTMGSSISASLCSVTWVCISILILIAHISIQWRPMKRVVKNYRFSYIWSSHRFKLSHYHILNILKFVIISIVFSELHTCMTASSSFCSLPKAKVCASYSHSSPRVLWDSGHFVVGSKKWWFCPLPSFLSLLERK